MVDVQERAREYGERASAFVEDWAAWREALAAAVANGSVTSSRKPWGLTLATWAQKGAPISLDEVALRLAIADRVRSPPGR
jgi:hypothetical protein